MKTSNTKRRRTRSLQAPTLSERGHIPVEVTTTMGHVVCRCGSLHLSIHVVDEGETFVMPCCLNARRSVVICGHCGAKSCFPCLEEGYRQRNLADRSQSN